MLLVSMVIIVAAASIRRLQRLSFSVAARRILGKDLFVVVRSDFDQLESWVLSCTVILRIVATYPLGLERAGTVTN
jgi:hypothetical protein